MQPAARNPAGGAGWPSCRNRETGDEYRSLIGYALGLEAKVRYGLLMKTIGESRLAEPAFRDAIKTYGRRLNKLDVADREWADRASIVRAGQNLACVR